MSTRFPARCFGEKTISIISTTSAGSSIRPAPVSPQACRPSAGPKISAPSRRRNSMLRRVAGLRHMAAFMAGTKAIGVRLAQISVLARSSAMPRAALAIRLAVAGMTSSRSLSRLTSMCGIGPLGPGCHSVVSTGEPVSASNVRGVTNFVACSVMTTRTWAPARISARAVSQLLYAAMPPETIRVMRLSWSMSL